MHVVVVGCGRVGSELATQLEEKGHTVAIVDKQEGAFRRLPPTFGGRTITGLGFDRDVLLGAGIEEASGLASVTNGDNSNILCARIARETFGVDHVVARIYDPRRAVIYQRLGVPTVATVAWTTEQVLRRLLPHEEDRGWIDPSGEVTLLERRITSPWVGKRLVELELPGRVRVAAVSRFGETEVVSPEVVGQDGDVVYVIVRVDWIDALAARLAEGPR